MKRIASLMIAASVGLCTARAQDKGPGAERPRGDNKRVGIPEVPEKLLEAAKRAVPGAEWAQAEVNHDLGTHPSLEVYEIAGTKEGKGVEVDVRADGTVEEIEEVIALGDVPGPARELLDGESPGFRVEKVERSTRPYRGGRKAIWYEFKGTTGEGAPLDVEVTEDGKYIALEAD